MVARIRYKDFGQLGVADYLVYSALPLDPLWSEVEKHIDFSFADELCAPLYSSYGQHPYAPQLKLKIHLVQRYYNLSDREMEMRMIGDLFIKRFLKMPVDHMGLDHSTLGLDRSRLGSDLFHAMHYYILAQALEKKLWGDKGDRWLIDAFHTYANVSAPHIYELIQQGISRILKQLKRKNHKLYEVLKTKFDVAALLKRQAIHMSKNEQLVSLSRLVVLAYALLYWLKSEPVILEFREWKDKSAAAESVELQAVLAQILKENVQQAPPPEKPEDDSPSSTEKTSVLKLSHATQPNTEPTTEDPASELTTALEPAIPTVQYTAIPTKDKPQNRIVNAYDPSVRVGFKSSKLHFIGDKVQVVESAMSHLVLNAEPIPGNEHDGELTAALVENIVNQLHVKPKEAVADSAYGYGKTRTGMKLIGIKIISPVPGPCNTSGLYGNDQFQYDPEKLKVTCPAGNESVKRSYTEKSQGYQHSFAKKTCALCPLRSECTNAVTGRSIFISDFADIMKEAKAYNETDEGKEAMKSRYEIERTNNEMKNHHGLKHPRTRGREKLRIEVKLTAMIINIKVIVKACRQQAAAAFIRRPKKKQMQTLAYGLS